MTAERDIAAFALPYAAGVFASVYLSALCQPSPIALASASAACILILLHPLHKRLPVRILYGILFTTILLCGAFSGAAAGLMSPVHHPATEWTASLGQSMKKAIEAITFNDTRTTAILTALITGDRQGLSETVTQTFRDSGASHILALSGLHLGIIYGLMKALLSACGNDYRARVFRSIAIISACSIYTLATGAAPSITRALLFIILGETASLTGRYRSTGTILLAALVLQLTLSPAAVKNAGFQLSYAAMAGIAYIFPRLKRLWPEETGKETYMNRLLRWIWNSASMSVACQLTTGPIAWIYFGTFPQYFILTNLIALPLVGLIIPMGLLTMVLDACNICPQLMISSTETLVSLMAESLAVIASL